jgi:hypothetical protein
MRRLRQLKQRMRTWGERALGLRRLSREIRQAAAVAGLTLVLVAVAAAPAFAGDRATHTAVGHAVLGHAVPRIVADHHVVGPVVGVAVPRRVVTVPLYRPYYVFLPRVYVGFGVWAGYPVTWPYVYAYPYPYPYPAPRYAYPPPAASAGVSFDITPPDASVFVDGTLVGTVRDFSPTSVPLSVAPGRHHIEVRAPGYKTLTFDVDAIAGQVVPYRGALEPEGTRS